MQVNNCLILNLDTRPDLYLNLNNFITKMINNGKKVERISGVDYKNNSHILNKFILTNRINLSGSCFRNTKNSFIGELGCYMGHYNCWKYVIDNNLDNCLILEDGIEFLSDDFENLTMNNKLDILFINEEMKMMQNYNGLKQLIGYGLQGYVVTKNGAEKLLEKCYTLSIPIDLQIRHLCNTNELNYSTLNKPLLKRKNDRISSIDGKLNNDNNLNAKQNTNTIIQRLLTNLIDKNINLDEFI